MVTWYAYGPKILVLKHGIWLVKLRPNELEPPFLHYLRQNATLCTNRLYETGGQSPFKIFRYPNYFKQFRPCEAER